MVLCILLSFVLSRGAMVKERSVLKKRAETEALSPASVLQGGGLPFKELEEGAGQSPGLPVEPVEEE
jgi:hypothetical protein